MMKRMIKTLGMVLVITSLLLTSLNATEGQYGASGAEADQAYSLEEMLEYALQDERLAQAEYGAIMEAFDVTRPFSNIEKAEHIHEALVLDLYEARDMVIPDFDGSDYVLIPESLEEIYTIGIEAEMNNIAMYEAFLEEDLDEDVRLVFEALKAGSEYHLAAFERAGGGTGEMGMARNGGRRAKDSGEGKSGSEWYDQGQIRSDDNGNFGQGAGRKGKRQGRNS